MLVPESGTSAWATIDRKSGIVGRDIGVGQFEVYFEGNRYGAVNLATFEQRVLCAAGRLVSKYPTIARAVFAATDFKVVGSVDWDAAAVRIEDKTAVDVWTGLIPSCPACGSTEFVAGQYTFNEQSYDSVKDDWGLSSFQYEDEVVVYVKCDDCGRQARDVVDFVDVRSLMHAAPKGELREPVGDGVSVAVERLGEKVRLALTRGGTTFEWGGSEAEYEELVRCLVSATLPQTE